MKKNSRLLFILGFTLIAQLSFGQAGIGIGTTSPDNSAMLHILSPGSNKGLLVPSFSVARIPVIPTSAASEGVFFYDPSINKFCFYHAGTWYTLNQMVQTVNSSGTLSALNHSGNMSVTGSISSGAIGTNTVSSNSISNSGNISTNTLNANGISTGGTVSSNVTSANTLVVPGFANNALVPSRVIVMWSGAIADIPSGWVLCDGGNTTPDLRGLFIVGAGGSYWVGRTGGEEFHTLTENEMPQHSHKINGTAKGDLGGSGSPAVADYTSPEAGGDTGVKGSGWAHENRPPFYALAYIMKL